MKLHPSLEANIAYLNDWQTAAYVAEKRGVNEGDVYRCLAYAVKCEVLERREVLINVAGRKFGGGWRYFEYRRLPNIGRKCTCCGEAKPASPRYFLPSHSNAAGLRPVCRVCEREKLNDSRRKKIEAAAQPPRPVRHPWEALGLEWSGREVYDPYAMSNRYGGSRV